MATKKSSGKYVDGFVLVVPKKNAAQYKKMARQGRDAWLKFGALDYKECVMDDATPPMVSLTFPKMAKARPGDEVWFSFVVYKNRKHRDSVNKKVMAHFEKKYGNDMPMPFDMKRFAYGGFKVAVGA